MRLACTPEWVALSSEKRQSAAGRGEFLNWLAGFAAEQGYEITPEEVEAMNREYNGI